MDKNEHFPFSHIPMRSLSLRLARSVIKMQHGPQWRVDKLNPVHDLVICLTGRGSYQVGGMAETVELGPGDAMLIPGYVRFRGRHGGGTEDFTGIAQHFSLELFGRGDVIRQLQLEPRVRLSAWETIGPMVQHYRQSAPTGGSTLAQQHLFMVLLMAYLQDAFVGWTTEGIEPNSQDHLSVQIMQVAARLSADPLGSVVIETLRDVPYNQDYFRRAFKERIGLTPQKFRELKRMEFAANRLGMGLSVKAVAAEMGYEDPYFFSRMFKRHLGASPSSYRERRSGPKAGRAQPA